MPEIEVIDNLFQTIQTSIVLQSIFVTLVLGAVLLMTLRRESKQDARDNNVTQKLLESNSKAQDTKDQLNTLGTGLESAVSVLGNYEIAINTLSEMIDKSNNLLQSFHIKQEQNNTINETMAQAMVDLFTEHQEMNERLDHMNQRMTDDETVQMKLVIQLERLNQNVEEFLKTMKPMQEAIMKTVTSENPVVEPPVESSSDKPDSETHD